MVSGVVVVWDKDRIGDSIPGRPDFSEVFPGIGLGLLGGAHDDQGELSGAIGPHRLSADSLVSTVYERQDAAERFAVDGVHWGAHQNTRKEYRER